MNISLVPNKFIIMYITCLLTGLYNIVLTLFQATISLLVLNNLVELVYYLQGSYDGDLSNDPMASDFTYVSVKLITYVSIILKLILLLYVLIRLFHTDILYRLLIALYKYYMLNMA